MRSTLAVILAVLSSVVWAQEGENLIVNPGYEQRQDGWNERGQPIVRDEVDWWSESYCSG